MMDGVSTGTRSSMPILVLHIEHRYRCQQGHERRYMSDGSTIWQGFKVQILGPFSVGSGWFPLAMYDG